MATDPSEATEAFGLALKALREKAGLSLRELGKRALYDYTQISRAEHGQILIPEACVRSLDAELHAGGLLVALRQTAGAAATGDRSDSVAETEAVTLELRLPGGGSIALSLSRRQFTQILAAGTLAATFPAIGTPDDVERVRQTLENPSRLDGEVLGSFRRTLDEFYRQDKMLGPGRLVGTVLAQIDVLDGLRPAARPPQVDPLYKVMGQHAEMAGWLLQDAGDLDAASAWSRRAAEWAQCAGDATLAAYMLIRQANIAVLAQDYPAVVALSEAARRTPGRVDPKLTALALQQQARGHAKLGEHRECLTLLDKAADVLTRHPDVTVDEAPTYLHKYDLRTLTEQSASCLQITGQADKAVAILEDTINTTSPALARDRGHLTAKLAVAVTRTEQGDPERAASLGMDALQAARQTGSARIVGELRTLSRRLGDRWPEHPGTRSLREAMAA